MNISVKLKWDFLSTERPQTHTGRQTHNVYCKRTFSLSHTQTHTRGTHTKKILLQGHLWMLPSNRYTNICIYLDIHMHTRMHIVHALTPHVCTGSVFSLHYTNPWIKIKSRAALLWYTDICHRADYHWWHHAYTPYSCMSAHLLATRHTLTS